jgi:hypothetical protein
MGGSGETMWAVRVWKASKIFVSLELAGEVAEGNAGRWIALLSWRARVSTEESLSGMDDAGTPVLNVAVKGRWSENGGKGVSVVWEMSETAEPRWRMWSIHLPSLDRTVGNVVVGWD